MKGELFINKKDAYELWGISLDENALSELMTPAPIKELIVNKSRQEHGKRVTVPKELKLEERNLTLQLNITAPCEAKFIERYGLFCAVLAEGQLDIETSYQPDVVYKTIYVSCSQFSQFVRGIGKFVLKLNEPNPSDRTYGKDSK